jgi:hypothetical protein
MRDPFDKLAKRLTRRALGPGGLVSLEHEVAPDAQAVDIWFEPDPTRAAERLRRGLLGRLMGAPSMIEPFHETPGIEHVRAVIHKQHALDRVRRAEARRERRPPPPFPQAWILSPGRPERVIAGYGFQPDRSAPPGLWIRRPADAVGLVVLRDLPRTRDTLLLRLMGEGGVLQAAIEELLELPDDAWEREVALEELIALRFEIPQDSLVQAEREFLMATHSLEHWKRTFREEGMKDGLVAVYRARFGNVPASVAEAIAATHDPAALEKLVALVATASRDDIAGSLAGRNEPAPARRAGRAHRRSP